MKTLLHPVLVCAASMLAGQDMSAFLPKAPPLEAQLEPGEGLAIGTEGGTVHCYGEAKRVAPMGSLAKLLWIQVFGDEWGYQRLQFHCRGEWNGFSCWLKKGHGKVDLAKALDDSCNLAFLAWSSDSVMRAKGEYGESVTRSRLEEVFRPFMGTRLRLGEPLPAFGPAWIGDGELLQTSPEQFAKWMLDPAQERIKVKIPNLLIPLLKREPGPQWWFKTGTAPVPGSPGATCAWVAGGDGIRMAVLYLPRGRGKAEGVARFKAILGGAR